MQPVLARRELRQRCDLPYSRVNDMEMWPMRRFELGILGANVLDVEKS